MALGEKPPQEYDAGKIQAILERIDRKVKGVEKASRKDLQDMSKELEAALSKVEKSLTAKIDSAAGEEQSFPQIIPVPQNLKVYELGFWGFAHVDPFMKWKYIGKLVGYEFYGSPNVDAVTGDFEIHDEPYTQIGTHYGNGPTDTYLYTKHPTDDDLSFVLDNRLVRLLEPQQLILENATTSTRGKTTDSSANKLKDSGNSFSTITVGMKAHNLSKQYVLGDLAGAWATVTNVASGELTLNADIFKNTGEDYEVGVGLIELGAYGLFEPKYKIKANGVTWNDGDTWLIRKYPQNKLFSIGAFCTFTKRLGTFHVKARSVGKGHSFSNFTEVTASEGISSAAQLEAPVIVFPIHADQGDGPDGVECTIVGGMPVCPNHGPLSSWDEIVGGTREIAHFDVFGYERSVVELVYNEIDTTDPVLYKVSRETSENTEGDVS